VGSILATYNIDSPQHGRSFRVDLVEGLDPVHFDYIDTHWQPILDGVYDIALMQWAQLPAVNQTDEKFKQVLGGLGAPDQHWSWRQKNVFAPGTNRKMYGLLNGGHVEAAMTLKFGRMSRLNPIGQPLVYVDCLAAAPWNRGAIQPKVRFHGLGRLMLGAAVAVSRKENCDGRCGLHSLQSAESFYRDRRMHEFPIDPAYNMRYFEFDAQAARAFTG